MKRTELLFVFGRILSDGIAFSLALLLAYYWRMEFFEGTIFNQNFVFFPAPKSGWSLDSFLNFAQPFVGFMIFLFALRGHYRFDGRFQIFEMIQKIFGSLLMGMLLVLLFFFFYKYTFFSRLIFGITWVLAFVFLLLGRLILSGIQNYFWARGMGQRTMLVLGTKKIARQIVESVKHLKSYQILGVLSENDSKNKHFADIEILGQIRDFESVIENLRPDEVLFISDRPSTGLSKSLIKIAQRYHAHFRFLPDELDLDLASVKVSTLAGYPIITLLNTRLEGWTGVLKSFFDYCVAFFLGIILGPFLLVIGLVIFFNDPKSDVFYRSQRVGKKGRRFWCYKFRTMHPGAEKQKKHLKNERIGSILFKVKQDPRVTKIGAFLRKYSLDELPQIWNILKGDMSFIGPRPHLPEEVSQYPLENLEILTIKPGLSGFAQIQGRSDLSFEQEMAYDIFYMKHWNFWLDVVIFLKTILVVFRGQNH